MHPFSILTLGIFIAGYTTARWDLVTRLYELAIFAVDHGVLVNTFPMNGKSPTDLFVPQTRATKGFAILSVVFSLFIVPARYLASLETQAVRNEGTLSHALLSLMPLKASTLSFWGHLCPRATTATRIVRN